MFEYRRGTQMSETYLKHQNRKLVFDKYPKQLKPVNSC